MKLKNVLITVNNMDKSKKFYKEVFGLDVILENDGNVILTEGLVLQDAAVWRKSLWKEISWNHNSSLLYFEEYDLETLVKKIKSYDADIVFVNPLAEFPWGQKMFRIYDPDGHLIEVRTPLR